LRRSRWSVLGWGAFAGCLAALVLGGVSRLLAHRDRAGRLQIIARLTESAARHRDAGAYGLALIDLDSAIVLVDSIGPADPRSDLTALRRTRQATARQDAEKILADLNRREDAPSAIGAWLSLRARISHDPDLSALSEKTEAAFQAQMTRALETDFRIVSAAFESRDFEKSLEGCIRIDRLLKHLPPDVRESWRNRLESMASAVVKLAGVVVTESTGELLEGSHHQSYSPKLLETATRALRDKGYVPPPSDISWRSLWSQAPFRLGLEITERREGNYHATQNRLTRIEAHLTLSSSTSILWTSTSVARSRVPIPHVPPSISKRLAIGRARIDQFEDLLYADAESLIDAHLAATLRGLPRRPITAAGAPASG
jgi:hypothetical protein